LKVLQRRDLAQAQATAQEAGVPEAVATRAAVLSDPEVQAVFVATPHANHCEDVLAAANAGKHVLCEKPLGLSAEECRRMVKACEQHGVKLFVGQCFRYKPQVRAMRAAVRDGLLGKLQSVRGVYTFLAPATSWRSDSRLSGGGPLMDLGPHLIDALRFISGEEIEEVSGFVEPDVDRATGRSERRARGLLNMSGGVWGVLETSFSEPYRGVLEAVGTKGSLRADYPMGQVEPPVARLERFSSDPTPPIIEALNIPSADIYLDEIDDVSRAILEPGHAPLCATGEDGVKTQAVIDALYASGRGSRREKVRIPPGV
jgi:predicted dehydrogenase